MWIVGHDDLLAGRGSRRSADPLIVARGFTGAVVPGDNIGATTVSLRNNANPIKGDDEFGWPIAGVSAFA
jgi:hypothetical protein